MHFCVPKAPENYRWNRLLRGFWIDGFGFPDGESRDLYGWVDVRRPSDCPSSAQVVSGSDNHRNKPMHPTPTTCLCHAVQAEVDV
jgi:hypothetical protein